MRLAVAFVVVLSLALTRSAAAVPVSITITADDTYELYVNGTLVGGATNWDSPEVWNIDLPPGQVTLAIKAWDDVPYLYSGMGVILVASHDGIVVAATSDTWKVSESGPSGWELPGFDDSAWGTALDEGPYDTIPWRIYAPPLSDLAVGGARWIWRGSPPYASGYGYYNDGNFKYCFVRHTFTIDGATATVATSWGRLKAAFR
jgi:hypothetical protein